jgi:Tol biopolymer transport system component
MTRLRSSLLLTIAVLLSTEASAQYFGRNKVRYDRFDFRILQTAHFDVYYYPEERQAAELVARMAERWYARLSRLLNHDLAERQPLILYACHPHFQQTSTIAGELGEGTGGVTEALKRRVVMPLAGPLAETDHVLGHEIVHAFQFDMTDAGVGVPGALGLPLWFVEGMAEYLSLGPVDPGTAVWMRDAARHDRLPTVRQLRDPRFFPYRFGHAFWAYVAGRHGEEALGQILRLAAASRSAEKALQEVLQRDAGLVSADWHAAVRSDYAEALDVKADPARYGRTLISERNGGRLNVSPALSPDGRQVVFLSERGLLAVEMYLADVDTGRIRRTLVKNAVDPHFESLQFVHSAGAWHPDGRRLIFAGVRKGRPVLTILDVASGRREREIPFPSLGEVVNPAWSPDGRRVAFAANVGGLLDLYVYDLTSGRLRRLTEDAFADLQPAWSPDGRTIAFVSDRFTTRLSDLAFGGYRLAAADLESGEVRPLATFEGDTKSVSPQWSPDGASLYFVADPSGIPNVHRLELASGRVYRVTDLKTGASGITALSPALSVAGDRAAVNVYDEGQHKIVLLEGAQALAGWPVADETRAWAALPPRERGRSRVRAALDSAAAGLPDPSRFGSHPYRPRLTLDAASGTNLTVGQDPLGTYAGGGAAFLFSDMLGDHTLGAVVQTGGSLGDLGGFAAYESRRSRWTWGASVEQIPLLSGSFSSSVVTRGSEDVVVERASRFRETHRAVTGYLAYPFSRAERVEVGAGLRSVTFSHEVETLGVSVQTGRVVVAERRRVPAPTALGLAQASAAWVYDTAAFGATGPLLGRRARIEVAPTAGSVSFTGALVDLRQYLMPVRPYTVAVRVLHYGRYGGGGNDQRLAPVFLGYPGLVRGYELGSFSVDECAAEAGSDCPVFDRLLGSRVAVANLELRVPPIGALGGRRLYGRLPLDLVLFADAGVAWTPDDNAGFLWGGRRGVASLGVAARVNLFGYLVVEVDRVRPLDRPKKGWHWQFNIGPGF